jgi:hypothetical protein
MHLGILTVSTPANPLSNPRATVSSDGRHVDAAGRLSRIPEHTIAVPEASRLAMLMGGLGLLYVLTRARHSRAAARECS